MLPCVNVDVCYVKFAEYLSQLVGCKDVMGQAFSSQPLAGGFDTLRGIVQPRDRQAVMGQEDDVPAGAAPQIKHGRGAAFREQPDNSRHIRVRFQENPALPRKDLVPGTR
jgi:hypothetical protein